MDGRIYQVQVSPSGTVSAAPAPAPAPESIPISSPPASAVSSIDILAPTPGNIVRVEVSVGENILQWSIIGECGESTDQLIINVVDGVPIIDLIDVVYCLNPISLNANVEGGGTWTVEPSTNIIIENPNSENTIATPTAYGVYTFSFEGCI